VGGVLVEGYLWSDALGRDVCEEMLCGKMFNMSGGVFALGCFIEGYFVEACLM
jgi:hypothetical protein